MKKRLVAILLMCAMLCSCQGADLSENQNDGTDGEQTAQTPSQNGTDTTTDTRLEYYEALVNDLQKEILALRTEIYVNRVEYEALIEDLIAAKPSDKTENTPESDNETAEALSDFFYTTENGRVTVTGYVGKGTAVNIPSEINGCPVVAIGDRAFMDRADIVSVVIPESVEKLGWFAFSGCVALQNVTLPSSVATIEYGAFQNCTSTLTIHCANGSYAERYAQSYGIRTRQG